MNWRLTWLKLIVLLTFAVGIEGCANTATTTTTTTTREGAMVQGPVNPKKSGGPPREMTAKGPGE